MKRPLAIVLTVAIFATVAMCFLRPMHSSASFIVEDEPGKVYTFTEPQQLELGGRDAERVEIEYVRTDAHLDSAVVLSFKSADDGCYTLGSSVYKDGIEDERGAMFLTERYERGEWRACENVETAVSEISLMPEIYVRRAFSSSETRTEFVALNTDEPGRYRVTFYFREYIPASTKNMRRGGSSGENLYEAAFEYEVPTRSRFSSEPRVASLSMRDYSDDPDWAERFNTTVAQINLLITNSHIGYGYLQKDECGLVRLGDSGEYVPDNAVRITYGEIINYIADPKPEYYVRPAQMNIWGWEYGAEYRLTMTLTENPDGSGKQYTLTLHLRFDE